jgi:hypothetical protein
MDELNKTAQQITLMLTDKAVSSALNEGEALLYKQWIMKRLTLFHDGKIGIVYHPEITSLKILKLQSEGLLPSNYQSDLNNLLQKLTLEALEAGGKIQLTKAQRKGRKKRAENLKAARIEVQKAVKQISEKRFRKEASLFISDLAAEIWVEISHCRKNNIPWKNISHEKLVKARLGLKTIKEYIVKKR